MLCTSISFFPSLKVVSQVIAIPVLLIALVAPAQVVTKVPKADAPIFLPAVTYGSGGTYAYSVAVADVNGDGKADLIVTDCGPGVFCGSGISGVVGVLLGNGDGTFQPVVTYDAGGYQTFSVAVADVNGDGKPDVVVSNSYVSNTVGVLLGNGDGTFKPVKTYNSGGGYPWSVAIADVNGDGNPDVLVANSTSCYGCSGHGLVGVLLGNGDGTFQPAVLYSSGGYSLYNQTSLAVSDLNGDGKLDVVVTNACGDIGDCSQNGSVAVLLGNGDGTFQQAVSYDAGALDPSSIAVADLNGDGRPDILIVNNCTYTGSCTRGTVGVLLGNGDGSFKPSMLYASGGDGANSVAAADVNGDGKVDVVVSNFCASSSNGNCPVGTPGVVGVLLGNGDGTLGTALVYPAGGYWGATGIGVADVNGDGRPDLLAVNIFGSASFEGSVGVLLNNTPFCAEPPTISLSITPKSLWPPDGKMVPVTISGTITDASSGCTIKTASYAVKDEYGRVQPSGAVTLGTGGTYSFTVWLQASRNGADLDGRLYTVTVSVSNNAGKTASQAGTTVVPHDQGP